LDRFLADGWSGAAVVEGKLGILRLTGPRDSLRVVIGFVPLEHAVLDSSDAGERMKIEGARESWGWVTTMFLPSRSRINYSASTPRGVDPTTVCQLEFISDVLATSTCPGSE
jgi:hypothetical protein